MTGLVYLFIIRVVYCPVKDCYNDRGLNMY